VLSYGYSQGPGEQGKNIYRQRFEVQINLKLQLEGWVKPNLEVEFLKKERKMYHTVKKMGKRDFDRHGELRKSTDLLLK
jgi:hypothetical protein